MQPQSHSYNYGRFASLACALVTTLFLGFEAMQYQREGKDMPSELYTTCLGIIAYSLGVRTPASGVGKIVEKVLGEEEDEPPSKKG